MKKRPRSRFRDAVASEPPWPARVFPLVSEKPESVHVSLVFQIVESPRYAFYVTNEFWLEAPWMKIEAMLKEGRVFVGALPAEASW